MNRRKFLAGMAALPALPILLKSCAFESEGFDFPITVHSDRPTGHLVFESENFPLAGKLTTETLIVGGGVAGLSAASGLPHQDFLLCELSDRLGGTSAATPHGNLSLAQGAHYDLEYPSYYGDEVLGLLSKLKIIEFEKWKNSWRFTDRQYVIPHENKNQCYENGKMRSDVLPEGNLKDDFLSLMQRYSGKMPMPSRMISEELRALNNLTFSAFLNQHLAVTPEFLRGLTYHMLDDWGGTADQVSALAGIHYFQCRPYYREVNQLFSPPQGNDYFVKKLARQLPADQVRTGMLVKRISKKGKGWKAQVIDVQKREIIEVEASNVIYAGQKHALKYVMPDYFPLFEANRYAPWLVMNFVLDQPFREYGFWQNEMLVEDQSFLGFINSSAQHEELQPKQVLTAYYCLPEASRKNLAAIDQQKEAITSKTLTYLEIYFNAPVKEKTEAVYLNAMGHAMPIPVPGYLFGDANSVTGGQRLAFAGVDHHRLPLLFEAVDSGLQAVTALYPNA